MRMQLEILPHRELAVERERLRHVADVLTRLHIVGAHRFAEQFGRAFGDRQQPRHHFHGGGFSAAVRAEEPENLAAFDAKAHMVDGDEIAEPAGQPFRLDRRRLVIAFGARRHDDLLMLAALFRRSKAMKASSSVLLFPVVEPSSTARLPSPLACPSTRRSAGSTPRHSTFTSGLPW